MNVGKLKRRPKHLHNFTGLTVEQFEMLCVAVAEARAKRDIEREGRQRAVGGGRKAKLSLERQLLVVLMYYRLYVTQILLGYLFDLDDSNVSRLIGELRPMLQAVLPLPVQETLLFAKPKKRIGSLEELLEKHPELEEVLVDATEQELQKPKDKARHKSRYSGKKKRHTLKTQVTSTPGGLFVHLSRSIEGRVSDITLLRGSGMLRDLPPELGVRVDRGYDGIAQDYPKRHFEQPYKARRNKPLDLIQTFANSLQNSARVKVENALAHLKRFKLLAGLYRGPEHSYDDTFLTIAGLHNFRKLGRLTW